MRLSAAIAVLVLAAAAGDSVADPAEAKTHMETGLRRYNTQDYAGAIAEWREAYLRDPDPNTLFAIGQAQRMMGDCEAALVTYRTVLQSELAEAQATEVQRMIAVCEQKIAEAIPPPAPPPAPTPEPAVTTPPESMREEPEPWFKDLPGMTLLGAGVVSVAVGGTFFALSRGAESDADAATRYDAFASAAERAHRDRIVAVVGGAVGAALITGAIVRFATRSTASSVDVAATVAPGHAGLTFARSF